MNTPIGEKIVHLPAQHQYYPLNTGKTIQISLYNEDIKTNGNVTFKKTADNTVLNSINTIKVTLINNGILHLFSRVSYYIVGNEINSIDNPGIATTMTGI